MTGTVRAVIDGNTYTATERYHSYQHSGDPREFREFTPDWALRAIRRAGYDASDVEGGTVTVVADGALASIGMGKFPESETGSADRGGFGFGGLDAGLDVLNYGYTADRSFTVQRIGTTDDGQDKWRTSVDGEVVDEGWTRPFQIHWEAGNGGML